VHLTSNRKRAGEQAISALKDHPTIYRRGGNLVRVMREVALPKKNLVASGAPRIGLLPKAILGAELSDRASIVKVSEKGDTKPDHPPAWLIDVVYDDAQHMGIRPLMGIVEAQVIRSDGSVLIESGYDVETGLILENAPPLEIPIAPTRHDVEKARASLEHAVCDSPFGTPAHLSAWVAAIATPVSRFAFEGPSPLFLFDAPTAGSGKTLLARVASIIATGNEPSKFNWSSGEESEQRKLITTIAAQGERIVLLDNLIGELGGSALCDALTATRWSDRLLKENRSYDGPLNSTWFATGNNTRLGPDMHRRVLHVRLEPNQERPEERADWTHPNLLEWARQHRADLLRAMLIILRAYHVAGRPRVQLRPWGSYEGWSAAVRAPLVWAGFADPALTREELITHACLADDAAARLVRGWHELGEKTAGQAVRAIYPDLEPRAPLSLRDPYPELREAIEELAPGKGGRISSKSLGRLLAKHRARVIKGLALQSRIVDGETLWSVAGKGETRTAIASTGADDDGSGLDFVDPVDPEEGGASWPN
jgi:hypothetical protein